VISSKMKPGNQLALGLTLVGAAAMAIAAFLPLYQPTGLFRLIQDNTIIQTSGGWVLLAAAVGIAAGGFWASQGNRGKLAVPITLCALTGLAIILLASNKDFRTLYPVGAGGSPNASQQGTVTSLGIAVYVAGAGAALALVGLLMMLRQNDAEPDELETAWTSSRSTKKCPDCAETILADAKVCKHCGYRCTSDAAQAEEPSTRVKCSKCPHVQRVPLSQTNFTCEECGARLKRKAAAG
jgi:hypothetical protein